MVPASASATERPLPEWAVGQPRAALQTLLFLDTWDPATQSSEDGALLGLLGCDGSTLTALCTAGQQASVLRFFPLRAIRVERADPSWHWVDAQASWRALAPLLDGPACDRFSQVCAAVLLGQGSSVLRGSMTLSLARLGNSDGLVDVTPKPSERAAQIVAQALPPDPARWLGLQGSLTRLAEAAPEAFLACVERTLAPAEGKPAIWHAPASSDSTPTQPTIFAISRALAILALDVNLLPQVTLLLARLAAHCDPSKPSQRTGHPVHTLEEIFDPRWPKTNATIEERLTALEPLTHQQPTLAFTLFVRLIAARGAIALNLRRPEVLRLALPSMNRGASPEAKYGQQATLLGWLKDLADDDGQRWAALVQLEPHLFADLYLGLLRDLQARGAQPLADPNALWAALRDSLSEYRPPRSSTQTATKSQDEAGDDRSESETLARALYEQLTPANFVEAHAWLFGERPKLPLRYTSASDHNDLLRRQQAACVDALCLREDRWEQLTRLAPRARLKGRLAELLAGSRWGEQLEQEWKRLLALDSQLALAFLALRIASRGWPAMEAAVRSLSEQGKPAIAANLAILLSGRLAAAHRTDLWTLLDSLGDDARRAYWQNVGPADFGAPQSAEEAVILLERLMAAGRWDDAADVAIEGERRISTAQRLDLLQRAREAGHHPTARDFIDDGCWPALWESVAPQGAEDLQRARQEERAWLPLFGDLDYTLRFLPSWLADEPAQVSQIVRAGAADPLLQRWRGWPGEKLPPDEEQDFLYSWVQEVLAAAQDPSTQARLYKLLARLLARPRGRDGFWPCEALRRLLQDELARGADELWSRLQAYRRDADSDDAVSLDEHIHDALEHAADCARSADAIARTWPRAAELCRLLAASYQKDVSEGKEQEAMWYGPDGPVGPRLALQPIFPLTELQVENFRGVMHATLFPLHSRLNIFYGRNASGKTTLLDALRLGLRKLVQRLPPNFQEDENSDDLPRLVARDRHRDAVSQKDAPQVRITLSGERHRGEPLTWVVERNYARGMEANDRETAAVTEYFEALSTALGHGDLETPLPVFAFYGAGRLPSTQAETAVIPRAGARTRADGLRHALDQVSRFEQGTVWFTQEWVSALQAGPGEESPTLKALQQALDATLLTPEGMGIKNPHLKKKTQVLALDFVRPGQNALELELGQLSDGFRTLFALVTDLLRRIVESNPAFEGEADPATRWRNTRAVVLIDEIDAHLHPSWQKTVLSGLLAAFPHAQFFVTTHSPLVLGAERDATVWELEDGKVSKVGQLYGKTPDALLQDHLETELRPRALQNKLDEASALLDRGELAQAAARIASIAEEEQLEEERPELVKLRTRLRLMQDRAARSVAGKQPA